MVFILSTCVQEYLQEQIQEYDVEQLEPVISALTRWSGSLTHLASDLGQARQKYICRVHL
jgi:hypothetical protein